MPDTSFKTRSEGTASWALHVERGVGGPRRPRSEVLDLLDEERCRGPIVMIGTKDIMQRTTPQSDEGALMALITA